ncbi:MAG TPA: multiheme c-type cytochrome [Bryobacteraceae bacterium]|nr:multiheme c-type cytochrome [Bryobacteraceae bacterium]
MIRAQSIHAVAGFVLSLALAAGSLAGADLQCGTCHLAQAHEQPKTAMGRALQLPGSNSVLNNHPLLTTTKGVYTYRVETHNGLTTYAVSDATGEIKVPIRYSFGFRSQTYVLEYQGRIYESLVSYFAEPDALDTTIGDDALHPQTLLQAFGRELDSATVADCFGCHSTGSGDAKTLHLAALRPGVTCDHCHEDALLHQNAALKGKRDFLPKDLKQNTPYEISELCGKCHRTWETVMRLPIRGPVDVRFQPYRLANSKCFDGQDSRLSCITCHDPHQKLLPEAAFVDTKCLACHAGSAVSAAFASAAPVKVCPVAKSNCASCHMPKIPVPGSHRQFTDHQIRVVKAGSTFPN